MFDFAWTEVALIAVVALIAIGPKDMPVAIKAVAEMVKKARRMAGEFQTHVDEMVREANLDEVRSQINEIRSMDVKGMVERAVDGDGTLRKTFSGNPLDTPAPYTPTPPPPPVVPVVEHETRTLDRPTGVDPAFPPAEPVADPRDEQIAPSFIPPAAARVEMPRMVDIGQDAPAAPAPPAFIPPSATPPDPKPGA